MWTSISHLDFLGSSRFAFATSRSGGCAFRLSRQELRVNTKQTVDQAKNVVMLEVVNLLGEHTALGNDDLSKKLVEFFVISDSKL